MKMTRTREIDVVCNGYHTNGVQFRATKEEEIDDQDLLKIAGYPNLDYKIKLIITAPEPKIEIALSKLRNKLFSVAMGEITPDDLLDELFGEDYEGK